MFLDSGICLKIFIENQEIFKNQKKFIIDRVLLALDINPSNDASVINWDKFLEFKKLLITKDATLQKSVEFMIKVKFLLLMLIYVFSFSKSRRKRK